METESRPLIEIAVPLAALTIFLFLLSLLIAQLVGGIGSPRHWLVLLAVAPLAHLAADLASGLAHWFCDNFLSVETPFVGRIIIYSFREHHRDPLAMTRHGFVELNGTNCLPLVPVVALGLWFGYGLDDGLPATAFRGFLILFSLLIFLTNQFHVWAHVESRPRIISWLQRKRLILPPDQHDVHHSANHDSAYCITSGWMNRALDAPGVLDLCGRLLVALGIPRDED